MGTDGAISPDLQAAFDAAGIVITPEGRARARRQLDEAAARHSELERDERRRAFLARVDEAAA